MEIKLTMQVSAVPEVSAGCGSESTVQQRAEFSCEKGMCGFKELKIKAADTFFKTLLLSLPQPLHTETSHCQSLSSH